MSVCPFCGDARIALYAITIAGQSRRLMRCRRCEACSPDTPVPEEQLEASYHDGYFSLSEWEITKSRLLAADYATKTERLGLLAPHAVYLEIGGSYGFFADWLRRKTGTPPDMLELSQGCRHYVKEHFPELHVRGGTLTDIPAEPRYTRVFGFHLLEHLQDLAPFLRQLAERMAPGGLAFFLTPNASSHGFIRHGVGWGWSCTSQHCEFLSPFIPAAFLQAVGFDVVSVTSARPATIHTPSSLLVWLDQLVERLDATRIQNLSWRAFPAKAAGRLADGVRRQLRQNDPRAHLLPIERFFHLGRGPNRHDELQLVLKRRSVR